jgi:hypothetical protein
MATITLSSFLIILQVSTILKCSCILLSQQASLSAAAIMMELSLLSNKFREPRQYDRFENFQRKLPPFAPFFSCSDISLVSAGDSSPVVGRPNGDGGGGCDGGVGGGGGDAELGWMRWRPSPVIEVGWGGGRQCSETTGLEWRTHWRQRRARRR